VAESFREREMLDDDDLSEDYDTDPYFQDFNEQYRINSGAVPGNERDDDIEETKAAEENKMAEHYGLNIVDPAISDTN